MKRSACELRSITIGLTLTLAAAVSAQGQTPFESNPDWVSADTQVSTGAALADLDRDGWIDLIVANGNDMAEQRLVVYYNQGDGTLPTSPTGHRTTRPTTATWTSPTSTATAGSTSRWPCSAATTTSTRWPSSTSITGHALDHPGLADHRGRQRFCLRIRRRQQRRPPGPRPGNGLGVLAPVPLLHYVYLNTGGALARAPHGPRTTTTTSREFSGPTPTATAGSTWSASAAEPRPGLPQLGGTLETTASWQTTDTPDQDGIMAALPAMSTATACGPHRHRQHPARRQRPVPPVRRLARPATSRPPTVGATSATTARRWLWPTSTPTATLDLATGRWWGPTRVFLNRAPVSRPRPTGVSSTSSVIEKIVFGDLDRDGLLDRRDFPPTAGASSTSATGPSRAWWSPPRRRGRAPTTSP